MKSITKIAPTLALAFIVPLYASQAKAANTANQPASSVSTANTGQANPLLTFSAVGHAAMQNINDARLALFNGNTGAALHMMKSAETSLAQAQKDAPAFQRLTTTTVGHSAETVMTDRKAESVPVDGRLTVADDYIVSPEKKTHIDKANEHFKKGEQAQAFEELKLAGIDLNYTMAFLPISKSQKHLEQAIELAKSGKYYQANLALKSVEDSIAWVSVNDVDTPKLGSK